MKKLLALLAVLWTVPALGQGQLPAHSIPIAEGPGIIGFSSIGPCTAGQSAVWNNGSGADPVCAAISATMAVGTSAISGGTNGFILYNNNGFLGNIGTTGTGNVVLSNSPTVTGLTLQNPTITGTIAGSWTASGLTAFSGTFNCIGTCQLSGVAFGTFATQNFATPPTIGGTTPAPGFFTTLSATGNITAIGTNNNLGTITTGVWNGSPPPILNGGTGAALTASNGGIVYSGASAFAILAGTVTAGQCLLSGSSAAPTWGSCSGAAAVSAVSNSDGTLTISPTTGAVVASLALGHVNSWTGAQTFPTASGFGSGTSNVAFIGNGGNTNTSDGSLIKLQVGGVNVLQLGNSSAIYQTAYNAQPVIWAHGANLYVDATNIGFGTATPQGTIDVTNSGTICAGTSTTTTNPAGNCANFIPLTPSGSAVNLYVAKSGVDTGTCTNINAPCLTILYTTNQAYQFDAQNSVGLVNINLGCGTWTESIELTGEIRGGGVGFNELEYIGSGSSCTTWDNDTTHFFTLAADNSTNVGVAGIKFQATHTCCANVLYAELHGRLNVFSDITFGKGANCHLFGESQGQIIVWNSYSVASGTSNGSHICTTTGALVDLNSNTMFLLGTESYAGCFLCASVNGTIYLNRVTWNFTPANITATTSYDVELNGVVDTVGKGCGSFPGGGTPNAIIKTGGQCQ